MSNVEQVSVALTGPDSHILHREAGVGSIVIGPHVAAGARSALRVDADAAIDWSSFDRFTVPAGYAWPRWFVYRGDDAGFFAWAGRRPIESFQWHPSGAHDVDARDAQIDVLAIDVPDAALRLALPDHGLKELALQGATDRLHASGPTPAAVTLKLKTGRGPGEPVVVGPVAGLQEATRLTLSHEPLERPISLTSLRAWPKLTSVSLHGSFTDFEVLAEFPELHRIELRFVPDLEGMPQLSVFAQLDTFIGYNIAAEPGKKIRTELRSLAKTRDFVYANVSQLRTAEWFAAESGLPYSGWEPQALQKKAVSIHRAAQKAIAAATTTEGVEAALVRFTEAFNGLPAIETSEREDLGAAIDHLVSTPHARGLIAATRAAELFDRHRDY